MVFTIIKVLLVIVAAVIFITATFTVMSKSRDEWQDYYDNIMAGKENEKYEESLPLVFEGVSVELKDGVSYYANGKAFVRKEDFQVTALFSEKGKITEKSLEPSEFEMVVPEGFATVGGKVVIKYLYQPPTEDGVEEAPAPILRVAEIDIALTPVSPVSLKIIDNPYRVYYSESMTFDPTGIQLEAEFNTGDKVVINDNDISFSNTKLTQGTNSVKVYYTKSGVTVGIDVDITVKSESEYSDGEIVSISPKGLIYFVDGQNIANANIGVLAMYESGNRFVLPANKYTVSTNTQYASLSEKCILSISLKEDSGIQCTTSPIVFLPLEAENAVLVGDNQKIHELDGSSITFVEGFADENTMTFNLNSSNVVKGQFNISIANNGIRAVALSDVITLKVNGRCYLVPSDAVLPARNSGKGYDFINVSFANIVLNEGNNVIELIFNNVENTEIAIDKLNIVNSEDALTIGENVTYLKDNYPDKNPMVTVVPTVGFMGNIKVNLDKDATQLYSMGGVSDGRYIYVSMNGDQHLTTVISKIDPKTYTVVAQSAVFSAGSVNEDNSRLFILGDTLYCIIQSGKIVEIALDEFVGFGCEVKSSSLSFDKYGTVIDATWNESTGRLAVLTVGRKLHILDSASVSYDKIQTTSLKDDVDAYSVTSDDKFIYVGYKAADGVGSIDVDVLTWDGEKVGSIKLHGIAMDGETTFSVQAIYMHDGQLYTAISSWGSRNNKSFFTWKVDVDTIGLGS